MKPKIAMVTIPVADLKVSESFYRQMFELREDQISSGGDHTAFILDGGLSLVLFERAKFAEMTRQEEGDLHSSSLILTHAAANVEEVNEILLRAQNSGGLIVKEGTSNDWSFTGCFQDPNGHVWEVLAWNS